MNATFVQFEENRISADGTYESAYTALKARYEGHGTAGAARNAAAEHKEQQAKTAMENPVAYRLGQIMEKDYFDRYRSGYVGNEAVMTVDDVKRLFFDETGRDGREAERIAAENHMERRRATNHRTEINVRPAAAYRVLETYEDGEAEAGSSARRELVIRGEERVAAKVEREAESDAAVRMRKLARKAKEWLPEESVGKPKGIKNLGNPVAGIALVLVFAMMLSIPVILNVLLNSTASEIGKLESELRDIEEKAEDLQVELDSKNDLRVIEDAAVNDYGMIRLDQSTFRYLRLKNTDMIEDCTSEKQNNNAAVLALLNALGIRVGNE